MGSGTSRTCSAAPSAGRRRTTRSSGSEPLLLLFPEGPPEFRVRWIFPRDRHESCNYALGHLMFHTSFAGGVDVPPHGPHPSDYGVLMQQAHGHRKTAG